MLRAEQLLGGHPGAEGGRQGRGRGAWVQQGDADLGQTPPPFERQGGQQLVLGRLGGAIGIPAAQLVIADAANARRERCAHGTPLLGHQRQLLWQNYHKE